MIGIIIMRRRRMVCIASHDCISIILSHLFDPLDEVILTQIFSSHAFRVRVTVDAGVVVPMPNSPLASNVKRGASELW